MAEMSFTPDIAHATEALRRKLAPVVPDLEWAVHAPYVAAINALKAEKNAVILAHNYMTPEIFHGVADFVGDSLQLARLAAKTDARIIVQAGVHFMAETSKVLSPDKTVLIPDPNAGCSLAAAITAADVVALKRKHPGLPVVTYVNTSAEVKAESDVCCTSSNAAAVAEDIAREWGVDTVIMVPDEFLARNTAQMTAVKIVTFKGHCEVHERFTATDIRDFRSANPGVVVMAHPECPPEVVAEADFSGSTSGMIGFVARTHPAKVLLVTECSMSDNVAVAFPKTQFVRPCNLCPHMKTITLPKILHALETGTVAVEVDPAVAVRARKSIERMLAVAVKASRVAA